MLFELLTKFAKNFLDTESIRKTSGNPLYDGKKLDLTKHSEIPGWINKKLDKKLKAQLEDMLSVISGSLPWWVSQLVIHAPFLFSTTTRKQLFRYTAFGQAFTLHWIQEAKVGSWVKRRATLQTELNSMQVMMDPRWTHQKSQSLSDVEENIIRSSFWVGNLQANISKLMKGEQLLHNSALWFMRMNMFPSSCRALEVQFENETGFGQAVTQSFYVEVANMMMDRKENKKVPMWIWDEIPSYVQNEEDYNHIGQTWRKGLLIQPLPSQPNSEPKETAFFNWKKEPQILNTNKEVLMRFKFLGRLVGKALREGFIVPVPLSEEFFALVKGQRVYSSSLPRPGSGYTGEFVGLMWEYNAWAQKKVLAAVREFDESFDGDKTSDAYRLQKEGIVETTLKEEADRDDFKDRFVNKLQVLDEERTDGEMPLSQQIASSSPVQSFGDLKAKLEQFAKDEKDTNAEGSPLELGKVDENLWAWFTSMASPSGWSPLPGVSRGNSTGTMKCSFHDYVTMCNASFLQNGMDGWELVPGGEEIEVDYRNVGRFVDLWTEFHFQSGIQNQVWAFRAGFNDVLPVASMNLMEASELKEMICGEDTIEWERDQLSEHLHPSGTLSWDHQVYGWLLDILCECEHRDRSRFLDFVTSCPRLPPGGINKVHIEVVGIAPSEKQKFPYSRACSSQLYLTTSYTSKKDLHFYLHEAMYSSVGNHEKM